MKTESLHNTLWVVQYRPRAKPRFKKKPWRVYSTLRLRTFGVFCAYRHRDEARMVAAGQAGLHPDKEFRPRRYGDTGKA